MKINQIHIKNFRSIKDYKLTFDHSCRILVGINESGKSNLLKALSLLSSEINPTNEDVRIEIDEEDKIEDGDSYVRFIFNFLENEYQNLFGINTNLLLAKNPKSKIIKIGEEKLNILDFFRRRYNEIFYIVSVKKKKNIHPGGHLI